MMGGRGMVMGRKRPWGDQWDCGPPTFHGNKYPRFKCPGEDELEILARRQMALMRRRVMLRRMEMMEDREFLSGPDFRLSPDMLEFHERGFLGPPRPLRPTGLLGPLEPLEPYGLLGPPEPLGPFDPLERPGPVRPPEPLGPFDPLERPLGCPEPLETFDPLGRLGGLEPPGLLEPPGPMGSRRGHRGGFPGNYDVDTMRDFGEDGAEFSREMRPGGFHGRGFHRGFGPDFQGGNGGRKGDGGMDEGMGVFEQERGGGPFDEFGNHGLGSGGNVDRGGFEREGRWEKRGASHWRGREKEEGKSDHGRKQGRETSRDAKKVGKIEGSYGDKSEGNSSRQWAMLFGDSMPNFADTFKNGTAGEREENQTAVEPGSSDSKAVEAATGKASADGDKALGVAQRNHCTYGDKSDSNSRRRWALLLGDSMLELSGMFGEKKNRSEWENCRC
ncbi:collagen, type I, alpha 1b-like [Liolophura sinensis]|uniref:collagen, type I, alpha 1b-like n=1 Tax=Liolophura sinensis TaxID=3198878 RepID=UPI0031588EE7